MQKPFLSIEKITPWKIAFFAFLIAGIPLLLGNFFNDEIMFKKVASRLLDRAVLYRDVVDNKPPLIYYTYAFFFYLSGTLDYFVIRILSAFIQTITPLLIFLLAKEWFNKKTAVLSGFLSVLTFFSGFHKDFLCALTETYMNIFVILSLYFFIKKKFSLHPGNLFFSGFFMAIAFLYRQHAGIYLLLFFPGILLLAEKKTFSFYLKRILIIGIGFFIPILFTAGYFIIIML